jgi:5'-nucleotidase / UDP-sugar diphosphatase
MKRVTLIVIFAIVCVAAGFAQQPGRLVILHSNDLHSKLRGFAPETAYTPLSTGDDATVGGFARLSTLIAGERTASGENLLVLDAGDFLMGTLFHHFEAEDGFQLRLMKSMGYDVVSIGNHEFDDGPETFAKIVEAGAANGKIPEMVLSNIVFNEKEPADDELEALFNSGVIRRNFIVERPELGLKIGIFALMGIDAADVAPAAAPVTFGKQIKIARKIVKELKANGCNMIICLSHSGLSKDKDGVMAGEDYKLASKVKGIDLIISGHTHTTLREPLMVKGIPIVQTGSYGANLGRVTFNMVNGQPVFEKAELLAVNDEVQGDETVEAMIEERIAAINDRLLAEMELNYGKVIAESSFDLVCDEYGDLHASNLGPLVADAIHTYVNRHDGSGSDISIVAAGVIRDAIRPGEQSVADIFRVMSLGAGSDGVPGYPLSRVYVTGRELKNILEILMVAWKKSPSNFIYYSGVNVKYDPSKGMLRKITSVDIVQGNGSAFAVDLSKKSNKLYSITANSYILEFIGIIKSMSFGLINVVPKNEAGIPITDFKNAVINFGAGEGVYREGKEWLALIEFLSGMADTDGNGVANIDERYLKPAANIVAEKR